MSFLLERPNADFLDLPEAAAEFSHRTCLEKRSVGSKCQNNPFSYLNHMTKKRYVWTNFKFWSTSLLDTAARIFLWTSLRLELMGEAVQLFCRSEGSPSPQVEWFDNNREKILPTSSEFSDYEVLNYDRLMRETNSILQWISLLRGPNFRDFNQQFLSSM